MTTKLPAVVLHSLEVMLLASLSSPSRAQEEYRPKVQESSDEARFAIAGFQKMEGFEVELFAAEPLLANPVIFTFDDLGRAYVCETFRHKEGVTDTRDHMAWLLDDLSCRTVQDRVEMIKRLEAGSLELYTRQHERLRLLEDRDGDGAAETATVFADGFHEIPDGIAAGVLAHDGNVYYACIPDLWLLRDEDGDGRSDVRRSLHTGYGVHINLLGHDLHGLCLGPDGRLYFSIGDRGFHLEHEGRVLSCPDTGAVLRCELDGSHLEVFATGLRNPQELLFDEYGNLFTGDNNSDGGDKARLVHVVEGGDCGWRVGYQWLEGNPSRGPWNEEKLWHPPFPEQAAYVIPPIANLGNGPSGFAYHPGTALNGKLQRHFFLCDFRGEESLSGVHCFTLSPRGAGFELGPVTSFLWKCLVTDVEFAPDGNVYVSDWVHGWDKLGKGRLYRIRPAEGPTAACKQVEQILARGLKHSSAEECLSLLEHLDQRIRWRAQYELSRRGPEMLEMLWKVASTRDKCELARLHALRAINHIERRERQTGRALNSPSSRFEALAGDASAAIRAEVLRVAADLGIQELAGAVQSRLEDPEPRVRFFAAIAFARLRHPPAIVALAALLERNDDQDVYLRHAAVMGLLGQKDPGGLTPLIEHSSPAVRMGALLALRRMEHPSLARFLKDPQARLVLEAARAIHDLGIGAVLPYLGAMLDDTTSTDPPLLRRMLNACYRIGGPENAQRLARYALRDDAPTVMRAFAFRLLARWGSPGKLDPVLNSFRPLADRPLEDAQRALVDSASFALVTSTGEVLEGCVHAVRGLKLRASGNALASVVRDPSAPSPAREAALRSLADFEHPELRSLLTQALGDSQEGMRAAARELLPVVAPELAVRAVRTALHSGAIADQQSALLVIAKNPELPCGELLEEWLSECSQGRRPLATALESLQAADARADNVEIKRLASTVRRRLAERDPQLGTHFVSLEGGDAERGRKIFLERSEVQCLRCHKLGDQGAGEAGPDLKGVAVRLTRVELLESIVLPNRRIAEGFHNEIFALKDGVLLDGKVVSESSDHLRILRMEGDQVIETTIATANIEKRKIGLSSMPESLAQKLSPRDLRDLVEFLSILK